MSSGLNREVVLIKGGPIRQVSLYNCVCSIYRAVSMMSQYKEEVWLLINTIINYDSYNYCVYI